MSKWEMMKWSDVIAIKNGRNQAKIIDEHGKYPIYGSGGIIGYANDYICNENTVIIGRKGNINKPIFVDRKFWNVDTAFGLEAIPEKLHSKYLYYFCLKFDFERLNTTTTIPSLTKVNLLKIDIPLPPINIQKQIATVLDSAMELINLRKQRLAELDNLIKSVFYDMFGDPATNPMGWKSGKLDDVGKVGSSRRVFTSEFVESGIPFFRGTEVASLSSGEYTEPKYFISVSHYETLKEATGVPAIGDLLLPSICSNGEVWRVDSNAPFYFKDGRVLWIHVEDKGIDSEYLHFALREKLIRDYWKYASGTTFAEMKIVILKDITLLLPPLPLQTKFATIIEKIEDQKKEVKKSIEESQLLFNSLMSQYFE